MPYRSSRFIDFNTGELLQNPQLLWNAAYMNPAAPPTFDDKLNLFECRVEVWQLGVAAAMLREITADVPRINHVWSHAAYGLVSVVFSYFEMIGKTLNPNSRKSGTSGADFAAGFCDVYPAEQANVRLWYGRVRCGLYHLAYTKDEIFLHGGDLPNLPQTTFGVIPVQGRQWCYLNPHTLVPEVIDHFAQFMARLRSVNEVALRTKCEAFIDGFHAA